MTKKNDVAGWRCSADRQPDDVRADAGRRQSDRRRPLGGDQRRLLDGDRFRPLRTGAGEGRGCAPPKAWRAIPALPRRSVSRCCSAWC